MKKLNHSSATVKRYFSVVLAVALLACACFAIPVTVSAEEPTNMDSAMAIKASSLVRDSSFGQVFYLEPSTQYVFSYKYTQSKADTDIVQYYTSETSSTSYTKNSTVNNDNTYNVVYVTFTTVSGDTAGVIKDASGKIKSFVGIGAYQKQENGKWISDPKYANNEYFFGEFSLTKSGDTENNLFLDPGMTSIQEEVNDDATWGALLRNKDYQISGICWETYTIPNDEGHSVSDFFRLSPKNACMRIGDQLQFCKFVQTITLEADTEYVFGYYHSGRVVNWVEIPSGSTRNNTVELVENGWNRQETHFTTGSSNTGSITGLIGFQMGDGRGMVGHYYGALSLYKKSDATKTNLLRDARFNYVQHAASLNPNNVWTDPQRNQVFLKGKYNTNYSGTVGNEYFEPHTTQKEVIAGSGTVKLSDNCSGYNVQVEVTAEPDEGFWTRSLTVDGAPYSAVDENSCVYFRPVGDVLVKAEFKEILIGDVNDDDVVNVLDLVRLKKYLADEEGLIDIVFANADADSSMEIDATDLGDVAKNILNG